MVKQIARKPTAKKAIKAGKSTASSKKQHQLWDVVSSPTQAAMRRRNKMILLQEKREEARHRAREWATRELKFGGKKNGSTLAFSPASSAASVPTFRNKVIDLNDEEEDYDDDEEDVDKEEEEGSIHGNFNQNFTKRVTFASLPTSGGQVKEDSINKDRFLDPNQNKRVTFANFPNSGCRVKKESIDEDCFFDAMEFLPDDEVEPDATVNVRMSSTAPERNHDVNVRDFHSARRRSLASKLVSQHEWQSRTKTAQPLDPCGYSFSTYVSKPNP